jgi:AraC-like DNA-binding protein
MYEVIDLRPYAILFNPFKEHELICQILLLINNAQHSKIDFRRLECIPTDEVPFYLNKIIEYINDNINAKIEVKELVKLSAWSYDYFIKLFKKYLYKTPYEYILHKKINKSKAFLIGSNMPITEIAIMLSFESYSNYFNAFKKEVGLTPKAFRNQAKVNEKLKKTRE